MTLFGAFDDIEDMMAKGRRLVVNDRSLETALSTLGVQ